MIFSAFLKRKRQKIVGFFITSVCALLSAVSNAVELGDIRVMSPLNQPLQAEIFIDTENEALDVAVTVGLASRQAHRDAGLVFSPELTSIEFRVDLASPSPRIALTTQGPVTSPFLRFLVDFQYQNQRLFRDYTVMLDPVDFSAPEAPAIQGASASGATEAGSASIYPGDRYGPINYGDTLMGIARSVQVGEGISVKQRMVALFEDNPEAFIDANMNLLRAGEFLHIPSERFMKTTDAESSAAVYESHLVSWLHRQANPEAMTAAARWTSVEAPGEDQSLADAPAMDYVLRIVSPASPLQAEASSGSATDINLALSENASKNSEGAGNEPVEVSNAEAEREAIEALSNRLVLIEEALGAKEIENETLNQQIVLLQQQLEQTVNLIELQETQLARAQQQLEQMLKAQEAMLDAQAKVARNITASPEANTGVSPKASAPSTNPGTAQNSASEAVDAAKSEPVIPPPWQEPGRTLDWLSHNAAAVFAVGAALLDGWLTQSGGSTGLFGLDVSLLVAAGVILLLVWILLRLRRRGSGRSSRGRKADRGGSENRRSLFAKRPSVEAQTTTVSPAPAPADSVGAGFVTEIETQRGVAVNSDDVDPLTEAEIFLAYGRGVQAEETLRHAISRSPHRADLKLKLLEVYQSLGKSAEFAKLAGELKSSVEEGSPESAHLESLNAKTAAGDKAQALVDKVEPEEAVPDRMAGTAGPGQEAVALAERERSEIDMDDLAFDVGGGSADTALAPNIKEDKSSVATGDNRATSEFDDGIDFELDALDLPNRPGNIPSASPQADMADAKIEIDAESAAYDLDISRPEGGEMLVSEDDDPAARLDLAEAYLQIGDLEAAREILDDLRDHEDVSIASRCKTLLGRL
jgi:pilus assembly protein FimV